MDGLQRAPDVSFSASSVNFMQLKLTTPALVGTPLHDPVDKAHVARWQKFQKTGMGYAMEHATRPATISFAVASSPLALLAWYVLPLSLIHI